MLRRNLLSRYRGGELVQVCLEIPVALRHTRGGMPRVREWAHGRGVPECARSGLRGGVERVGGVVGGSGLFGGTNGAEHPLRQ